MSLIKKLVHGEQELKNRKTSNATTTLVGYVALQIGSFAKVIRVTGLSDARLLKCANYSVSCKGTLCTWIDRSYKLVVSESNNPRSSHVGGKTFHL